MRKSELFEAFDLFDVRDFGKVITFYFLYIYWRTFNQILIVSYLVEVGMRRKWSTYLNYVVEFHIDGLAKK